jgi:3-hydroxybutyrate dehydrogenase
MQGKVAIVTGAAQGIGLAIAERLADAGVKVVINDVSREAKAVASRLGGTAVTGDLSEAEVCRRIVDTAVETYGTVHILVNNAGFQHVAPLEQFPPAVWDKMLAVMMTAPFLLTQHVWPHMTRQQWGRIINITSNSALKADADKSAYTAAKHGLLGLTRTTALEGGPHGITAHPVCPGLVRTSLIEDQIPDIARRTGIPEDRVVDEVFLRTAPIKRFIEPAEVAELVHFLCGDAAAAMSGSPLLMDLGKGAG